MHTSVALALRISKNAASQKIITKFWQTSESNELLLLAKESIQYYFFLWISYSALHIGICQMHFILRLSIASY